MHLWSPSVIQASTTPLTEVQPYSPLKHSDVMEIHNDFSISTWTVPFSCLCYLSLTSMPTLPDCTSIGWRNWRWDETLSGTGGGDVGGATGVEGRAWLFAACLVVRKSFSQELRIRWEGKRREYCRGGVLCVFCVCVCVWICMMCAQWKVCVCVKRRKSINTALNEPYVVGPRKACPITPCLSVWEQDPSPHSTTTWWRTTDLLIKSLLLNCATVQGQLIGHTCPSVLNIAAVSNVYSCRLCIVYGCRLCIVYSCRLCMYPCRSISPVS